MLNKVNIILKQYFKALTLSILFALSSLTAIAADLQVNSDGILTGAKNVAVGSFLYDVDFAAAYGYGSVNGNVLFPGAFTFNNLNDALAASQALLDQVFINSSSGQFDDNSRVPGCGPYCFVHTPYEKTYQQIQVGPNEFITQDNFKTGVVFNASNPYDNGYANGFPPDYIYSGGIYVTPSDYTIRFTEPNSSYAIWSVAAVPEPETYCMLIMGLGLMGFVSRQRKG